MKLINSAFIDNMNEVNDNYKESLQKLLNAKLYQIDHNETDQLISTVNDLITSATDGKITNLISQDDVKQWKFMVLLNILSFSGNWTKTFKVVKELFTNSKGEKQHVDMIKSKSDFYIFINGK